MNHPASTDSPTTVIVDTNVVSEFMRPKPQPIVLAWLDSQFRRSLFVTAVTEAEIRAGIAFLPEGRRRRLLVRAADQAFGDLFAGRILPFDTEAARAYAKIAARCRRAGRPISQADGQIAAIAHSRDAMLATRNVQDFKLADVHLVNPWPPVEDNQ